MKDSVLTFSAPCLFRVQFCRFTFLELAFAFMVLSKGPVLCYSQSFLCVVDLEVNLGGS